MEAFERELLAATAKKRLPGTVVAAANREGIFTFGVMALRWVFLFCFLFTLLLCIPYCQNKIKSLKFTKSLNRYIHLHQTLRQHQSPPRRPLVTEASTFCLASATKLVTSVATVQCVERGLISLDEDIADYLPEWRDVVNLKGFDESTGSRCWLRRRRLLL